MTIGIDNITQNVTNNITTVEAQDAIGEVLGNMAIGSYSIIGFLILGAFIMALYKARVSLDVSATVMVPTLFAFGKYGLLPGGASTSYGLVLAVGGLLSAGLIRYFGRS